MLPGNPGRSDNINMKGGRKHPEWLATIMLLEMPDGCSPAISILFGHSCTIFDVTSLRFLWAVTFLSQSIGVIALKGHRCFSIVENPLIFRLSQLRKHGVDPASWTPQYTLYICPKGRNRTLSG
jgi:hypothetical protein